MLFTMVSAVPFISASAFWATNVENMGESAITTMPQNKRKPIKSISLSTVNMNGEIKQQIHDRNKAEKAVFLVPIYCDM